MKNNRKKIIDYFIGMPATFEWTSKKDIDDPYLYKILIKKGFRPISSDVGMRKTMWIDTNNNQFIVKYRSNTEKTIYNEVLPFIREQNYTFKVLQFPELANVILKNSDNNRPHKQIDLLFIKYIDGANFNNRWDEISNFGHGGRGLDTNFAKKIVGLLGDLSLINFSLLAKFNLSTFDFNIWKSQNFPFLSKILIKRGFMRKDNANKALQILSTTSLFNNSKMIFTNGDFYPRNLIELKNGKIVIVDWEGRKDYEVEGLVDQRNAFINYIENHVAFFFIHMWGNPLFQRILIKETGQKFDLTAENLQAAILIKTLEQSTIWPDEVALHQIEIFNKALDINFIRYLLK